MAKIILKSVILSFPNLFVPKGFAQDPTSKAAYSASFLFPRASEAHKAAEAAMLKAAQDKWLKPGEAEKTLAMLTKQGKTALRDGAEKDFDGYGDGVMYVAARSPTQPLLVGRDPYARNEDGSILTDNGRPVANVVTLEQGLLYAGAVVSASLDFYAQDSQFGKRINAVLKAVQFVKHGDAFGAAAPRPDEFENLDADGSV